MFQVERGEEVELPGPPHAGAAPKPFDLDGASQVARPPRAPYRSTGPAQQSKKNPIWRPLESLQWPLRGGGGVGEVPAPPRDSLRSRSSEPCGSCFKEVLGLGFGVFFGFRVQGSGFRV